ncbi:hypothetical protein Agabi119p4_2318 [Agaricus bisporus var. burnettii]|uniref:Uncharacterized protein n=1 Tax=Agaricus bisporus var. burnettii TaxID=192524 RepID=A0A8H7KK16_AGABI|nr:hypothetical protein Agabi119p4_2318 [Agaricus bisporus var. burnettii]
MSSRPNTRAKNKDQHPGASHTRYDARRRNGTQIAMDNIAEAEARLSAIHATADRRQKQIKETAKYEAELQDRSKQRKNHAARPDLEPLPTAPSRPRTKLTITIKNPPVKPSINSVDTPLNTQGSDEIPEGGDITEEVPVEEDGVMTVPEFHDESEYEYPPMSVTGDSDSAPPTLDLGDSRDSDSELDGPYKPATEPESDSQEDYDDEEAFKTVIDRKKKRGALRNAIDLEISQMKNKPPGTKERRTEFAKHTDKRGDTIGNKRKASNDQRKHFQDTNDTPEATELLPVHQDRNRQASKRSKMAGTLGGLRAEWKSVKTGNLGSKQPGDRFNLLNQEARETSPPIHNDRVSPAHKYDNPESNSAQQASLKARSTRQMGITVEPARVQAPTQILPPTSSHIKVKAESEDQPSRQRIGTKTARMYTKHDLPFPRHLAAKLVNKWSKTYMACLYDWVATLENPWQANSHPEFTTKVKETWLFIFPELSDDVGNPAIEFLASGGIRSWRSKIGSNTLSVIDHLFKDKAGDDIREEMRNYLPAPRFLWRNPDATDGQKEGWLSDIFLRAFVYHVQYMLKASGEPTGYPVGAVALTAAAVERGLNLWKQGARGGTPGEFNQQDWGTITRHYAHSASQLTNTKWDVIIKATIALMPANKANVLTSHEDLESELFPADDRACVVD